jgi:hypothetical protein
MSSELQIGYNLNGHGSLPNPSCVGKCGCANIHPKNTCVEYIGVCAQNFLIILSFIVNIIGGPTNMVIS